MNHIGVRSHTAQPLDSDHLLELEDRVNRGANWLIYLSILTILASFVAGPILIAEGTLYLILSVILRLKQSRSAAVVLCVAAVASCAVAIVNMSARSEIPIGFALPEVAVVAAVLAAINAFRLQRMLKIPLAPSRSNGPVA
jgi:hypothetical protein